MLKSKLKKIISISLFTSFIIFNIHAATPNTYAESSFKTWEYKDRFIIVEPTLKSVNDILGHFVGGLEGVGLNGKFGYINKLGEIAIPFKFDECSIFQDDTAIATLNQKKFFIDTCGNKLFDNEIDAVEPFINGSAMTLNNDRFGLIEKSGKYLIQPIYEFMKRLHSNVLSFKKNGKYGLIDTSGKILIEPLYDDISSYNSIFLGDYLSSSYRDVSNIQDAPNNGLYLITLNKKNGLINEFGQIVVKPEYDFINEPVGEKPYIIIGNRTSNVNVLGFMDRDGKVKCEPSFDTFSGQTGRMGSLVYIDFYYGLAKAQADNLKWGFINTEGKFVIQPQFFFVKNFIDGKAEVILNEGEEPKYINVKGEYVASSYKSKEKGGNDPEIIQNPLISYMDLAKKVVEPSNNKANDFWVDAPLPTKLHSFAENVKFGIKDTDDKVVFPAEFTALRFYDENFVVGFLKGKWLLLDSKTGETVLTLSEADGDNICVSYCNGIYAIDNYTADCTGYIFTKNPASVIIDGKVLDSDVSPLNVGGRVMVPMRAVFEALNAEVTWDDKTSTAKAKNNGGLNLEITIGSKYAKSNDKDITLDVPALIYQGRTLVPIRFVSEGFAKNVKWDESSKSVIIENDLFSKK